MQGSPYPTPPSWVEADSIRETLLYLFDDPADREAICHVGRMLHDLALETTREPEEESQARDTGDESQTRAELRAAAADLRYTSGYQRHLPLGRVVLASQVGREAGPLRRQALPPGGRPGRQDRAEALMSRQPGPDRVQTGVRMERRLVKVLKA